MDTSIIIRHENTGSDNLQRSTLSILVIDDSKTARFAMRKHLEHLGYRVDTVACASEAYRYLESHVPDVIFLDNIMPGINGMEVLGVLQHNQKTAVIPVIFCTSIDSQEFFANAIEHGASRVLHKPPTIDGLHELLANIGSDVTTKPAANKPFIGTTASHPERAHSGQPAPTPPDKAARANYLQMQSQIDAALKRLREELTVQLSELHSQLIALESSDFSEEEIMTFRQIAREETDSLKKAMRVEMDAIHRRLDRIALRQIQAMRKSLE